MIEELRPTSGMPNYTNRFAWLSYAAKLNCAFLIVQYLPKPIDQSQPVIVMDSYELFLTIISIKEKHPQLTLEIYNPNLDHQNQLESPLVLKSIKNLNLDQYFKDINQLHRMTSVLGIGDSECKCPSQFDLEYWFYLGHSRGAAYMIVTESHLVHKQYFPIYSNQMELLDRIIETYPDHMAGAVAVYDLNQSFEYQYRNSQYISQAKPGKFYTVREENLTKCADDDAVEGFRRRLLDFFCYSQLERPDSNCCIGSAVELLVYGKKLDSDKRIYAVLLLLHALSSVQAKGPDQWRALPYSILLKHYKNPAYVRSESFCFYSSDLSIRHFGMVCQSLFPVKFEAVTKMFNHYYTGGFELRGLLHLLWQARGSKEKKIKFIQQQLKVDGKQDYSDFVPPSPSPDMVKELYMYLKPQTLPNPFAEYFSQYGAYKQQAYHIDTNLLYALQTDPTPRLQFARERKLCEKMARGGDLGSILNLSAYYFWCEGSWGDYPKALKWLRKGVEQNHPTALCILGWAYYSAMGVKRDVSKGIKLLQAAADMGYATAYYYLSICHEFGDTPIHNIIKAYAYLLISRWTLVDYPEFNAADERISYLSRSILSKNEKAEARAMAEKIYPTLKLIESEPAEYMGEVCQKELFNNSLRWKWGICSESTSSLPISQL